MCFLPLVPAPHPGTGFVPQFHAYPAARPRQGVPQRAATLGEAGLQEEQRPTGSGKEPMAGVIKPIFSILLFSPFFILLKTMLSYL